jgi:hypothetical protein
MKIGIKLVLVVSLIPQTILSCRHRLQDSGTHSSRVSSDRDILSSGNPPDTAVLYLGGFNSCHKASDPGNADNLDPIAPIEDDYGMSMVRWKYRFDKALSTPHRTLITCYPFWTDLTQEGLPVATNKVSSEAQTPFPYRSGSLGAKLYFRHNLSGPWISTQKTTLGNFLASLEAQLKAQKVKKVAIIGHSYGGYTAMLVAKALSYKDSPIKVTSLTTLDPISIDTCQPRNIVNMLQFSTISPACNQAPATGLSDTNITSSEISTLAANIPWTNLWQGADIYLHSSPISNSSIDNIEVIYSKEKIHGIINHLLFLYPDDKTNDKWPSIADSVISKMTALIN